MAPASRPGCARRWPREVKNGRRIAHSDLRHLRAFAEDYPQSQRLLLYRGRERMVREGVLCMPVDEFLAEVRPGADLPS